MVEERPRTLDIHLTRVRCFAVPKNVAQVSHWTKSYIRQVMRLALTYIFKFLLAETAATEICLLPISLVHPEIVIHMKHIIIRLGVVALVYGVLASDIAVAAENCVPVMPPAMANTLMSAYPNHRLLRSDLNEDDQKIWTNAYHNTCPGVIRGAFTGKREEYAALLVPVDSNEPEVKIVLLQEHTGEVVQRQITAERRSGNFPVLRRGLPEVYEDAETHSKVKALRMMLFSLSIWRVQSKRCSSCMESFKP